MIEVRWEWQTLAVCCWRALDLISPRSAFLLAEEKSISLAETIYLHCVVAEHWTCFVPFSGFVLGTKNFMLLFLACIFNTLLPPVFFASSVFPRNISVLERDHWCPLHWTGLQSLTVTLEGSTLLAEGQTVTLGDCALVTISWVALTSSWVVWGEAGSSESDCTACCEALGDVLSSFLKGQGKRGASQN